MGSANGQIADLIRKRGNADPGSAAADPGSAVAEPGSAVADPGSAAILFSLTGLGGFL